MKVVLLFVLISPTVVWSQDNKVQPRDDASRRTDSKSSADPNAPGAEPPRPLPLSKTGIAMLEARLAFANNDAIRKVKEVTWECVLISADTNTEIIRYTIKSHKKIAAKEGTILKKRVPVPLRAVHKVVSVAQSGKTVDEYEQLRHAIQQNRIIEIKYTDGSSAHP